MQSATIHFRGVLQPARETRAKVLYDLEVDGQLSTGHSAEIARLSKPFRPRCLDVSAPPHFGISAPLLMPHIEDYFVDVEKHLTDSAGADASVYCEVEQSLTIAFREDAQNVTAIPR